MSLNKYTQLLYEERVIIEDRLKKYNNDIISANVRYNKEIFVKTYRALLAREMSPI